MAFFLTRFETIYKMIFLLLFTIFYPATAVPVNPHPDEIQFLPGWNTTIPFKQYSGYLDLGKNKYFHYWFVESQRSPEEDPLLLWLNGGPGCSSLGGLLSEIGPFTIQPDGKTLANNTYSWNTVANVLFLESPIGVGFSYATYQNYNTDDDKVAADNYLALKSFFKKFPRFKKNDFYITGESYAGIYVPTLAVKVLAGKTNMNFRGFAIGNGCLDKKMLPNALVFYAYHHGIIGDMLWKSLSKHCCTGIPSERTCNFYGNSISSGCRKAMEKANKNIHNPKLNMYNIYAKCVSSDERFSRYHYDKQNLLQLFRKEVSHCKMKLEIMQSLEGSVLCIDTAKFETYLNQKDVREALHIPIDVQNWKLCSDEIYLHYRKLYSTMKPQIQRLLGSGRIRGLIYNGDADMACNFMGDQWFASSLELNVVDSYKQWLYDGQISGYATYYNNLTFLTVKGSGHMVPEDSPGPALQMITKFLRNEHI